MIEISLLRTLSKDNSKIHLTLHLLTRLLERGIEYNDMICAIQCGEIIEQYPNDYPHPSCLIVGKTGNEKILHIVCGTDGEYIWIITAYYPDNERWENDFKARKEP